MGFLADLTLEYLKGLIAWLGMVIGVVVCMWAWDIPVIGTGWWTGWDDPTWWQAAIWVSGLSILSRGFGHDH